MEEAVNDAILLRGTDDTVLARLIDIAITDVQENRPVFPNPLREPVLYKKLRSWIGTALAEEQAIRDAINKDGK